MKKNIHKSETRGEANHGWLVARHSFSFAGYHNPERVNFGALRVLNDDVIAGGKGFGTHPHDNMEIITIPIAGNLAHKDSMGNSSVIQQGDIQVMSAGTGVYHSEFNADEHQEVNLLQIWVYPNKKNVAPRYDQQSIASLLVKDEISQILSPNKEDAGVWINQEAWFHIADLSKGVSRKYMLKSKNSGVYLFVIEGEAEVEGEKLFSRDGIAISEAESFELSALSDSKVLLMEVPLLF